MIIVLIMGDSICQFGKQLMLFQRWMSSSYNTGGQFKQRGRYNNPTTEIGYK